MGMDWTFKKYCLNELKDTEKMNNNIHDLNSSGANLCEKN